MANFVDFEHRPSLPHACNLFKEIFGTASVCIEVGSRDGHDANFLRSNLGGEAIAIEADPVSAQAIQQSYKDMKVINAAITDHDGTTSFMRLKSEYEDIRGASSIYSFKIDPAAPEFLGWIYDGVEHEIIEVPAMTMETVINENNLQESVIDFIKIDAEGYSGQVLAGLGRKLKDIKMLHVETELDQVHMDHWNNARVARYMRNNGFKLIKFYTEWGPDMQDHLYINARFVDYAGEDLFDKVVTGKRLKDRDY